ncbi:uncharacterized protein LOC105848436 isoform X2 [Hydra vulgaris]|uniref:uncharacterized protein LOC105848436 isoform X2 n=1 Tax=Hydra vulgaris TaxID=6087 RepID=UPI000640C2B0|nr:uncharacterized protein LOC105848436 isoform X2 [Hydra vulgaris]
MSPRTEVLFYIVIIVVIVVKLLFWTVYLYIRKRRRSKQLREAVDICYEELPAVPQPAYVFSGLSPEDIRQVILIESLPGYQHNDPYKVNAPPPKYGESFCSNALDFEISEPSTRRLTVDAFIQNVETSEISHLLENEEDDYVCMPHTT